MVPLYFFISELIQEFKNKAAISSKSKITEPSNAGTSKTGPSGTTKSRTGRKKK
jgi:hypothetical protein